MRKVLHQEDLPDRYAYGPVVAIDTETMGLNHCRDRLCLVQLSSGGDTVDLVQIAKGQTSAPNLVKLLTDPDTLKLFHFARFDIAALHRAFGAVTAPVYCTKIASRLVRTYSDQHGLKALVQELLELEISKEEQSSDWGAEELTEKQMEYAANDVVHLHAVRRELDLRLERENRVSLAKACFEFLPFRAELDIEGWNNLDIFRH